jgi:serine/threonine protein kinase
MSSPDALDPLAAETDSVDRLALEFDLSWQRESSPSLDRFLAANQQSLPESARRNLLQELIKIDLEQRWRRGQRPLVEEYFQRFPDIALSDGTSSGLIAHEYEVRKCCGDSVQPEEYRRRFPRQGVELREALACVDFELAGEAEARAGRVSAEVRVAPPPATDTVSVIDFVEALRAAELMKVGDLNELMLVEARSQFREARDLARHALEQNWLTPYQANLLLKGRGAELVLGPYALLERLGEGATGQVFKARHRKMDRLVALKIIRQDLVTDQEVLVRFYREIRLVGRLNHPNIVHAYDAGPMGPRHVLAMEYVEGTDLGRLVKKHGPLPVAQACEYLRQAACGLAHAHERKLVHRDVKPANLLVTRDGHQVKVLDLGLGRLQRTSDSQATNRFTPRGSMLIGTPDYLAPEQAIDFHAADARADVYGLGCTLFHLLTGQPPFAGGSMAEKLLKHQQATPPALEQFRNDIPVGLEAVLRAMLAKHPGQRYPNAGVVAEAMKPWAGGLSDGPVIMPTGDGTPAESISGLGFSETPFDGLDAITEMSSTEPPSGRRKAPLPRHLFTWPALAMTGTLVACLILFLIWHWSKRAPVEPPIAATVARQPAEKKPEFKPLLNVRVDEGYVGEVSRRQSSGELYAVAFSPDGKRAVAGSENAIYVWNLEDWRLLRTIDNLAAIRAVAFAPDGKRILGGGDSCRIWLWDPDNDKPMEFTPRIFSVVWGVTFSPDGRKLAACGGDGTVRCWDLARPNEPRTLRQPQEGTAQKAVAFAKQGHGVVTAGFFRELGGIWRWDLSSDAAPTEFPRGKAHYRCVAASRDGDTIVAGDNEGRVRLLDLKNGADRWLADGPGYTVFAIAVAPGGGHALSGGQAGEVRLWDLATGKVIRWFVGHTEETTGVAFSPDGRFALSVSRDRTVRLWSMPEVVWFSIPANAGSDSHPTDRK